LVPGVQRGRVKGGVRLCSGSAAWLVPGVQRGRVKAWVKLCQRIGGMVGARCAARPGQSRGAAVQRIGGMVGARRAARPGQSRGAAVQRIGGMVGIQAVPVDRRRGRCPGVERGGQTLGAAVPLDRRHGWCADRWRAGGCPGCRCGSGSAAWLVSRCRARPGKPLVRLCQWIGGVVGVQVSSASGKPLVQLCQRIGGMVGAAVPADRRHGRCPGGERSGQTGGAAVQRIGGMVGVQVVRIAGRSNPGCGCASGSAAWRYQYTLFRLFLIAALALILGVFPLIVGWFRCVLNRHNDFLILSASMQSKRSKPALCKQKSIVSF